MNNKQFFNTFHFLKVVFNKDHYSTNSSYASCPTNYIGIVICGSGKFTTDNEIVNVSKGEIIFIPKDCKYSSYWKTDGQQVAWYSLGFDFFPQADSTEKTLQKITPSEKEFNLLKQITDNFSVSTENIGYLYSFLGAVLPRMKSKSSGHTSISDKAVDYIRKNPRASVADVAAACNVSESAFYSIIKKCRNCTPNEIRQKILCEKAVEMLISTDISIEGISSELGFSSSSYFRKILRKHIGKTPLEIRKENHF